MDGNNRWGKKNHVNSFNSYKRGAQKLLSISKFLFENHSIEHISAFALSKSNLKRPKKIINVIIRVLDLLLDQTINSQNFKFRIIFKGDLNFINKNLQKKISVLSSLNKNSSQNLYIYLNYSGTHDILETAKSLKNQKINLYKFKKYMVCGVSPDPEILIRSGGYKRISDFFILQLSFTELFFINKLWPDVTNSDVNNIINKYKTIERKFGH